MSRQHSSCPPAFLFGIATRAGAMLRRSKRLTIFNSRERTM